MIFLIAAAYCQSKAGLSTRARNLLDSTLTNDSLSQLLTKHQEIEIHYHKALTFVSEHDDLHAADAFLCVLNVQPGHEDADRQLDAIEARLPTMPQTKRQETEAYLRNVAEPYRHREPGSARPSEELTVEGLQI